MATLPPVPTVTLPAALPVPTTLPPANETRATSTVPTGAMVASLMPSTVTTTTTAPPAGLIGTSSMNATVPSVPTVALPVPPTAAPINATTTSAVPTITTTLPPNECSTLLEPGDVNTIIFNSDPLDQIVFFTLKDIPSAVGSLFVTDRPWDGENFVTGEGTLEYVIPEAGIKAGSTFGYGLTFPDQSGEWVESEEEKKFDLSTIGPDSLLIYCLTADDKPSFLSALTYSGNFSEPGKVSYDPSETALPAALVDVGGLALPFAPNYLYAGSTDKGRRDDLLAAFYNPTNFQGSFVPFEIKTSGGLSSVSTSCFLPSLLSLGLMILVAIS